MVWNANTNIWKKKKVVQVCKVKSQFFIGNPVDSSNWAHVLHGLAWLGHSLLCTSAYLKPSIRPVPAPNSHTWWSKAQQRHAAFLWTLPLLLVFVSNGLCSLFLIFTYLFVLHCQKKESAGNRINNILIRDFPFPSPGKKSVGFQLLHLLDG